MTPLPALATAAAALALGALTLSPTVAPDVASTVRSEVSRDTATAPRADSPPTSHPVLSDGSPAPAQHAAAAGRAMAPPVHRWTWPLAPRPPVERRFDAPASAYGAGHRGIDLVGPVGAPVRAVDAGLVTHAGRIAGRGTVTVLHPFGLASTYEPVQTVVARGDRVGRGQVIGELAAEQSHCAPRACLHLGARLDRRYLDPLVFLVGQRVRLLPLR